MGCAGGSTCVCTARRSGVALDDLGLPLGAVVEIPFMVDAEFFRPDAVTAAASARAPRSCTAGLELRDYPTLCPPSTASTWTSTVAAASPWSKRPNPLATADLPDNVRVVGAGPTTCASCTPTRTSSPCRWSRRIPGRDHHHPGGDVDGARRRLHALPRPDRHDRRRRHRLLRPARRRRRPALGDRGVARRPRAAARLGHAARQWVLDHADIDVYARRFADLVDDVGRAIVGRR